MTFIFNDFNLIKGDKVLLPSINLEVTAGDVITIQADTDYMMNFIDLLENENTYRSKAVHDDNQTIDFHEDVFLYRSKIGIYQRLNIEDHLSFWSDIYDNDIDLNTILNISDLQNLRKTKCHHLNDSETRRLAFSRSLVQSAAVFFFEDPTYHVDLQTKEAFNQMIQYISNTYGTVIIFTSSIEEAIRMGNKVYRINRHGIQPVEQKLSLDTTENNSFEEGRQPLQRISAKYEDKYILFNPFEIDYVESLDRQTMLHIGKETFASTMMLKDLEKKLTAYGFYRCHRSYLVNLQRIREVIVWSKNSYSLILDNHDEVNIPLSKNKYTELKELLNW